MVSLMRCANSRLFRANFCNAPAKRRWNLYENCTQWSGKCMQMLVQHIILKCNSVNRYLHRGIEQSWCEIVCGPGSKHCKWRYFASMRAWSEIETAERNKMFGYTVILSINHGNLRLPRYQMPHTPPGHKAFFFRDYQPSWRDAKANLGRCFCLGLLDFWQQSWWWFPMEESAEGNIHAYWSRGFLKIPVKHVRFLTNSKAKLPESVQMQ